MKYILQTLIVFMLSGSLAAQDLQLGWGYATGNTGADGARDIVVDAAGNSYIAGYFSGTVDFDPGPGVANLSVASGQTEPDAYVLKLDAQGNYKWVVHIGGTTNAPQVATRIALDTAGHIVVAGEYKGSVVPPPYNVNYFSSNTNYNMFILKLDTAGNTLWSFAWAGTGGVVLRSMHIDAFNNILLSGSFSGTQNFSTSSTPVYKSSGGFVVRLSESGGLKSVVNIGNSSNNPWIYSIASSDSVYYLSGIFNGNVDFDPGVGTSFMNIDNGRPEAFILRLDTNMSYIDVHKFGGGAIGAYTGVYGSMVIDNHLYVSGKWNSPADLDPDSTSTYMVSSTIGGGFYILRLSLSCNLNWVKTYQGGYSQFRVNMTANSYGDVFFSWPYYSAFDADPDPNNTVMMPKGENTSIIGLDSLGNFVNAFSIKNTWVSTWSLPALAFDNNDNLRVACEYKNTTDIDPGAGVQNITSNGQEDILVLNVLFNCSDTIVNAVTKACNSYTLANGQVVTQNGTYNDTLSSVLGCDSVVARNITITPLPNSTIAWQGDTAVVVANPNSNYTYQWYDCNFNQPIAGATKHYYKPTANGRWRVAVADGTCISESNCYQLNNFGLAEKNVLPNVELYPNPTNGLLTIQSGTPWQKVEVLDMLGRNLQTYGQHQPEINLGHLPSGVYLVKVYFAEGVVVKRVVRE